ncbi:uncharacterized protein LOC130808564 [Amaranthus tricolor]|uniref:uncharacterized protein LOC130808564 n=1 Tax=Amaranthus tricolor TaxID=29722 RepID=UPI00259022B2|nr:uncharacterized protein LOC130808564 [Amaranthus tricolor]
MADSSKFHTALTITNIKSLVPVTLDNEQNLLPAILKRNDTAEKAWKRLEALFQDNKASRATHLEEDFTNALFEEHNSIDNYCNYLQSIADKLADVDAPVTNGRLVLRLTSSLPDAYSGTVDFIQNQEPLPSFESCRSRLKMAERTIKARNARENGGFGGRTSTSALLASDSSNAANSSSSTKRNNNYKGKGYKKNNGRRKAQNSSGGPGPSQQPPQQGGPQSQQPRQQGPTQWPQWNPTWGGWTIPPCPMPAYSWQPRPNYMAQRPTGPGVLGPRPQAYNAVAPFSAPSSSSYAPTDIEAAMQALSFPQPDGNYYMDTGATSHMTADAGILSSYFNSSNKHHNIIVGSGHLIPIIGHGRTNLPPPYPPFTLNNVLQRK